MTDLVDTHIPGRVVMLVSIFVVLCLLQGISCRNIGQREYKRVRNRDSPFQRETETKLDIEHARGCKDCDDSHAVSHGQPTQDAEIDRTIHGPRFSEKDRTRNFNGHKMRRDHLKKNHEPKAKSKNREKRLKDADISHQEQKEVANWKSERRSRRRKNHQQTQPHSKMYASDPRRSSYRQQLPPGVARLESRLHPSISNSINKLKEQLSVVLQKIKRKVNEVNYEYMLIGNDTRKDVMVIRKELQKISDENNEVYDAILDTSQLVRYIMLRAHQKGLAAPAPQRMLRGPVLPSRDFRMSMYDVRLQERNSKYLMSRVTDMKRECIQQDSQSASIEQKVNSRLPITALEDLYVISRKVLSKLSGPIRDSFTRRRLDRYKAIQNSIDQNLIDARNLSRTAYYDLQYAKRLYQDNMRDGIRIKSERQNRNRRSTSRGNTLEIVREVNEKSTKLQQEAEYIENTIAPLLVMAKNKPRDGAYAALMTEVRAIAKRLESLIMKIDRKMDGLRIFIGDESILRERCEDLIEGSGDDDSTPIDCDQFEIESGSGELEIFSTEKPKLTSSTPPPVIEGSGDGDSDFVFVNATDTADNDDSSWYSSLWGDDPNVHNPYKLRDKLMEKASESSERSEKVNKRSEKITLRLEDLRFLKDKLNQREGHLQEYVTNASLLTQNWKDAKLQIDTSKQKIKALDKAFFSRLEEIQNKSKSALIKANAVLAEVKKANENKETKRATEEAKLLSDLISTVSKMKSGSEKLKSIKEISRNSCETVQRSAANLRNNIAQLRQKIVKARQIAQSMPISVVLDGSNHFLIPVPTPKQRESSISSFGICFKPTGDSMPIASFYSNTSLSYTITMIDRQTRVMVDDPSGNNIDTLQSSYDLELDKWYNLNLNRYGRVLELKTDDKENPENSVVEKKTMLDLQPLQEMPSYVTIGSGATKETFPENFRGCIGQVQVDGRYTGLTGHDTTGKKPLLCKDNCNVDGGSAMVFEGDGYAKFSLEIVYPSFKVQNILLGFRTVQKDGVLFLLNDRLQSLQVLISLTNGSLHVEARTRRGTTVVKSGQNTYANGSLHTIEITLGANEVDVRVVTNNDTFKQELTTQEITSSIDDGIFLGGLGSKSSLVTGKSKLRSIVACISKFAINKKDIPLFLMKESWNVYLGDCSRNIWFECVRFSEGSSPIVFPKSKDTKSIYVSVDRNSMGRILHYKRTDKFDIEILVDGSGIEISNIKTDDSTVIDSSPSYDVHWYQIAIEDQDDNKRLMVTFNGSSTFIPHASGGNWWNDGKKDSNYTLTIGGSEFHGGISRLLVNDKYVSMTNYRKSNNLGSCEKRASDIIDNKDIDEKPIC